VRSIFSRGALRFSEWYTRLPRLDVPVYFYRDVGERERRGGEGETWGRGVGEAHRVGA